MYSLLFVSVLLVPIFAEKLFKNMIYNTTMCAGCRFTGTLLFNTDLKAQRMNRCNVMGLNAAQYPCNLLVAFASQPIILAHFKCEDTGSCVFIIT